MKTIKSLFLFFAGLCFLVACNKDEPLTLPGPDLQSSNLSCGKVYKIQPTKGTDITAELQAAFDAAVLDPPGSVIELPEGEFDVGLIEVHEFNGSFVGAGKGKTIITSKTGLNAGIFVDEGSNWFLIKFIGGNIKMSEMTIQTPPGPLCDDGNTIMGLLLFSDFGPQYESETDQIKAVVNNVELIGQPCWDTWYNAPYALSACNDNNYWWGYSGLPHSKIDITVTNCIFDTFFEGAYIFGADGKLTIGTKNNGNIFNNCYQPIAFYEDINSEINAVSNTLNIITYGLDIDNKPYGSFDDELQYKATTCNIENNKFNIGYFALWLHDHRIVSYPGEIPMLIKVKNNQFNLLAKESWGGEMIEGVNAVFSNNKFTGAGIFGFYADALNGMNVWSENCLFLGNNFSTASFSEEALSLGSFTKNFTVVGSGNNAVIVNNGENNIITGMKIKKSPNPMGQTIVDNLRKIKEEMGSRHH
jgi:hypothetical protein